MYSMYEYLLHDGAMIMQCQVRVSPYFYGVYTLLLNRINAIILAILVYNQWNIPFKLK